MSRPIQSLFITCVLLSSFANAQVSPTLNVSSLNPGCPAEIEVLGAPGAQFVIAIDTGPGPVNIPGVGTLLLDLGPNFLLLVNGPQLGIPLDSNGRFALGFTMPFVDPSTLPLTLYAQALEADAMGSRLSNGVAATVTVNAPVTLTPDVNALPSESFLAEDSLFADLDGDGDEDLVVANSGNAITGLFGNIVIHTNQGGAQAGTLGTFVDTTSASLGGPGTRLLSLAAGDVDNDGDIDLFFGTDDLGANSPNLLMINQGGSQAGTIGTFIASTQFPGGGFETSCAEFLDVDGDLDLDLICGNGVDVGTTPEPNELFINDGSGSFTLDASFASATWNIAGGETDAILIGDLNQDGIDDLLFVRDGEDIALSNDGSGNYSQQFGLFPPLTFNSTGGAIEDFNGDGLADVFISNIGAPDLYYEGLPGGGFTAGMLPFPPTSPLHLDSLAADMDLDGDLDIVVGAHALGGGELSYIYWNQGFNQGGAEGSFVASLIIGSSSEIIQTLSVADTDQDGDLDLFMGSQGFFGPFAQDLLLINGTCQ